MKKITILILSLLVMITMTLSFVSCGIKDKNQDGSDVTGGETNSDINSDTSGGNGGDTSGDTGGDNSGDNTGGEDAVCTHKSTEGDVIKFSDYGSQCGGGIYSEKCLDCGEVFGGAEALVTLCRYESGDSGKCLDCGLELTKTVTQNGCESTVAYSATIGDTEIFNELSVTKSEHSLKVEITERSEGNCLITVATEKCRDCDFTNLISTLHEGGELDVSTEQAEEKSIRTRFCADCGYKEIRGFIEATDCTGDEAGSFELSLYNGEELLWSGKTEREASHSWQTSSVKYGNDCKDGVALIKVCDICAQREYETTLDHVEAEEKIDVDFNGACKGTMTVRKCSACDQALGITENPSGCYFMLTESEFINGGTRSVYECVECGLELLIAEEQTKISDCEMMMREITTLTQNGEVVFTVKNEYAVDTHYESSYDFTYELLGDSCLDGMIMTGVCSDCGDTMIIEDVYVENHRTKDEKHIDIDVPCGGTLISSECVCGEVNDIRIYDVCNLLASGIGSKEIDGVEFDVTTETCTECGVVRVHTFAAVNEDCNVYYPEQIEYILNGETVYDTGMCNTYVVSSHKTERKSMALGPSCEIDGMLMVEACEDCDYYSHSAYRHHYKSEVERIDLSEHGACGGYLIIERCPCDEGLEHGNHGENMCNLEGSYSEDENGAFNKIVCKDCIFTMERTTEYIYESCQRITDETVAFSIDGSVLYEFKPIHDIEEAHQLESTFRLLADHCYEGLYELSRCKDCDYEKTTAHYNCVIKESYEFSFKDYGVCDGAYYYLDCYCGDMHSEHYSLFCNMVEAGSQTETIDGVTYTTTTSSCETCGTVETVVNYLGIEGCYEYRYSIYNVSIGEKVLAEDVMMKAYNQSYHEMERTTSLLGESCLDGFYDIDSCTKCDYEASLYYDDHIQYQKYYYNGGSDCVHSVSYYECPCGEAHELNISSVDKTEDGYACDKCGLKVIETAVTKKENCKEASEITRKVYIGEELQLECVDTYIYDSHSFDAPSLSNQDGKDVITSKCSDCGFELKQEIYILVYEDIGWNVEAKSSFTVSEDGEYTAYISSLDAMDNIINNSNGYYVEGLYPAGEKYPVVTVELEKDESYEILSADYRYNADFSAFVLIKGQYGICKEADETVKLTTSDGKYELTLCATCHMILDVLEAPSSNS